MWYHHSQVVVYCWMVISLPFSVMAVSLKEAYRLKLQANSEVGAAMDRYQAGIKGDALWCYQLQNLAKCLETFLCSQA